MCCSPPPSPTYPAFNACNQTVFPRRFSDSAGKVISWPPLLLNFQRVSRKEVSFPLRVSGYPSGQAYRFGRDGVSSAWFWDASWSWAVFCCSVDMEKRSSQMFIGVHVLFSCTSVQHRSQIALTLWLGRFDFRRFISFFCFCPCFFHSPYTVVSFVWDAGMVHIPPVFTAWTFSSNHCGVAYLWTGSKKQEKTHVVKERLNIWIWIWIWMCIK